MEIKLQLAIEFLYQLKHWFVGLDSQHVDAPFAHIIKSIDELILVLNKK